MQNSTPSSPMDGSGVPLHLAAGIQDDLMVAINDLDRLQRLLESVCQNLSEQFFTAQTELKALDLQDERAAPLATVLTSAITALQFQDLASQLLINTDSRLRASAQQLANAAMPPDDDEETVIEVEPVRTNPVTQNEMDAGSIELF